MPKICWGPSKLKVGPLRLCPLGFFLLQRLPLVFFLLQWRRLHEEDDHEEEKKFFLKDLVQNDAILAKSFIFFNDLAHNDIVLAKSNFYFNINYNP